MECDSGDERWAYHELQLLRDLYPKHIDAKQGGKLKDVDIARMMRQAAKDKKWVKPRNYTAKDVRMAINRGALGSGFALLPAAEARGPDGPSKTWGPGKPSVMKKW